MIAPRITPPWHIGFVLVAALLVGAAFTWMTRDVYRRAVMLPSAVAPIRALPPHSPIQCSGNHCTIERRRVQAILAMPSSLGSMVRVVPSVIDWRGTNYYLFGIAPGSVAARLGLRNADRVVRINGRQFRNPEDALRQYFEVKHTDHITLDVMRHGALVRFDYEIR